ncbi:TetR/AcrR family transcriptional regulator [Liquorilactobacillus oeni]|uniref:Transcriptional regulator, TetR family n=1 Tax=Liquorilactobacillus oeni DSM 19972 TaxID=1423777 RepID=A0A0R1M8J2_9LACO|nr:TetR/AcrR family transcriptional regulator [Liquorilactobacillus oeni]KRL04462.1 transcriptional regulator, TetR family [Liquorilactobacillus oeni DSM 19972]
MIINSVNTLFDQALTKTSLSEKQKKVLKASLLLFSKNGFDRTSTKEIAEKAQVSEGTVYKQFKTKEGILAAILKPFVKSVIPSAAAEFITALSQANYPLLEEFLTQVVQNRMEFAIENKLQLKIFAQEVLHDKNLAYTLKHEIGGELVVKMGLALKYYQKQGQLVAWAPQRIAQYIISTVMGYLVPCILLDQPLDVPEASKEAVEFLIKGLKKNSE